MSGSDLVDTCFIGDVRDGLRAFIAAGLKAQTCCTSPPYYGLRDYGTASWDGGDAECDHLSPPRGGRDPVTSSKQLMNAGTLSYQFTTDCGKCGATRQDKQIGLEPTIAEYVASMVDVFRLVRDALTETATCWINLGDSYHNGDKGGYRNGRVGAASRIQANHLANDFIGAVNRTPQLGLKPKDLCGIPWRVAFALQADGWYLRSDIIWSKRNCMPESVTDRPTKSHEYLFLLAKNERYFYDAEAIKEESVTDDPRRPYGSPGANSLDSRESPQGNGMLRAPANVKRGGFNGKTNEMDGREAFRSFTATRNRRSVWTIATQPYSEAHFAVMPTALVKPCILAGSRPGDIVIDPFMGSGTVAKVAQSLGRRWYGTELNSGYVAMQKQRAAQFGMAL